MKRFLGDAVPYLLIVAIAALVVFGIPLFKPALASGGDLENCEPWRKAGQWTMYACEEDWELGVICIHSDSGFMSCKWAE